MFNGNHSKMNYTDSVRDLMIYGAQYTPADDRSWARQLRMAEPQWREGSPVPHSLCLRDRSHSENFQHGPASQGPGWQISEKDGALCLPAGLTA